MWLPGYLCGISCFWSNWTLNHCLAWDPFVVRGSILSILFRRKLLMMEKSNRFSPIHRSNQFSGPDLVWRALVGFSTYNYQSNSWDHICTYVRDRGGVDDANPVLERSPVSPSPCLQLCYPIFRFILTSFHDSIFFACSLRRCKVMLVSSSELFCSNALLLSNNSKMAYSVLLSSSFCILKRVLAPETWRLYAQQLHHSVAKKVPT